MIIIGTSIVTLIALIIAAVRIYSEWSVNNKIGELRNRSYCKRLLMTGEWTEDQLAVILHLHPDIGAMMYNSKINTSGSI